MTVTELITQPYIGTLEEWKHGIKGSNKEVKKAGLLKISLIELSRLNLIKTVKMSEKESKHSPSNRMDKNSYVVQFAKRRQTKVGATVFPQQVYD